MATQFTLDVSNQKLVTVPRFFRFSISALLVIFALAGTAHAQSDTYLHANVAGETVELVWGFLGWQPGQTGYVLRKQYPDDSDEWITIGAGPIQPGFFLERDWSFTGDATHQEEVQNRFQSLLESGRSALDPDELIGSLQSGASNKGAFSYLLLYNMFVEDFSSALLSGLAARDVSPRLVDNPTYGLFRSFNDGRVEEEPAATARPIDYAQIDELEHELDLVFNSIFDHVTITWTYPFSAYIDSGLRGFRVFEIVGEERNALGEARRRKPIEQNLDFYLPHEGSDPGKRYKYVIVPYDLFGNDYEAVTAEYVPTVDPNL